MTKLFPRLKLAVYINLKKRNRFIYQYCENLSVGDFRETAETSIDPDNNSETKSYRDKGPKVAIATVNLVIWVHNNRNSPF